MTKDKFSQLVRSNDTFHVDQSDIILPPTADGCVLWKVSRIGKNAAVLFHVSRSGPNLSQSVRVFHVIFTNV